MCHPLVFFVLLVVGVSWGVGLFLVGRKINCRVPLARGIFFNITKHAPIAPIGNTFEVARVTSPNLSMVDMSTA